MSESLLETPPSDAPPITPSAEPIVPVTPPVEPPVSAPPTWVGADGNFQDGWLDKLPEDMAEAKNTLGKYRSVTELGKAHHSLQQLLGKKENSITPLTDKSTPEEVSAYRKKMGVPESPEGYQLKPENLPEGMEWSIATEKKFAEYAHSKNIPAETMKGLAAIQVTLDQQRQGEAIAMAKENLKTAIQGLRDEWKGGFDANIALSKRVAQTLGLDATSPGLSDPNVVKALHAVGKLLSEDKLIAGDFAPTAHPGKAQALAIMQNTDPKFEHLHKLYTEGDEATVSMVRAMLKNG